MVNINCGHKARGSVMGINCLFGAIGILIVAKLGGFTFDKLDIASPFIGSAILSLILFILVLIPHVRRILDHKQTL